MSDHYARGPGLLIAVLLGLLATATLGGIAWVVLTVTTGLTDGLIP